MNSTTDLTANDDGREALRGVEASVLDLLAQVLASKQWAELLQAPLERAAAEGHGELAQKLTKAGAEIGHALHWAIRGSHRDVVHDLLDNGASVTATDTMGYTPRHVAAEYGETEMEMVQLLFKGG